MKIEVLQKMVKMSNSTNFIITNVIVLTLVTLGAIVHTLITKYFLYLQYKSVAGDKLWFDNWCILAHHAKQRRYPVGNRSRTQADWENLCTLMNAERAFTKRSKSLMTHAPNSRKWFSTVKTAVFGTSSSFPPLLERRGRLV